MSDEIPFDPAYVDTARTAVMMLGADTNAKLAQALAVAHGVPIYEKDIKRWRIARPDFEGAIGGAHEHFLPLVMDGIIRRIRSGDVKTLHWFLSVCDPAFDPAQCVVSSPPAFADRIEAERDAYTDLFKAGAME